MFKEEKKTKQMNNIEKRSRNIEDTANDAYKILMENRRRRKEIWKNGR